MSKFSKNFQKVTQVKHWTESLFSFRITRPKSFKFRSGEFVMIGLLDSDNKAILRAYSICSPSWSEELTYQITDKTNTLITFDKNSFNIVFAGNIGEAQDFESVLKAARELNDLKHVKWIFLGDGRALDKSKLLSRKYDILDNVSFPGRVPLSDVPFLLDQADALLISLKEGQAFSSVIPAKLQTYLQIGKPILGMLSGEGADIINQANVGLVCEPGNYKQLAKNILKLKNLDKNSLKSMSENGLRFSNKYFQREILLSKLNLILSDIAKQRT